MWHRCALEEDDGATGALDKRSCEVLGEVPAGSNRLFVTSTHHTNADEIKANPMLRGAANNSPGVGSWFEIDAQPLCATERRPDCAILDGTHVRQALPPGCTERGPIFVWTQG